MQDNRENMAAQKTVPGTGLGLPIAKHIAEAHGGRIDVESTLGHGAALGVFLPRAARSRPAEHCEFMKNEG